MTKLFFARSLRAVCNESYDGAKLSSTVIYNFLYGGSIRVVLFSALSAGLAAMYFSIRFAGHVRTPPAGFEARQAV